MSIGDEIATILSRLHASNLTGKLALKIKLRELGNPATTFLTLPEKSNGTKLYLESVSLYMQPHVYSIFDVIRDGHCVFRAIVGLLGFEEDSWKKIRKDLADELRRHSSHYAGYYRSKPVTQLLERILFFKILAQWKIGCLSVKWEI